MANGELHMANCKSQTASRRRVFIYGREATGFAFKNKNTGEWENTEVRDAPPQGKSHFVETLEETLHFLRVPHADVVSITEMPAGMGKDQGKGRGKRKGKRQR